MPGNDADPIDDPYAVATIDLMVKKLAVVRETRRIFGMKLARAATHQLGILPGLAEAVEPAALPPSHLVSPLHQSVARWVEECCELVPGRRVPSMGCSTPISTGQGDGLGGRGDRLANRLRSRAHPMRVGQIKSGNVHRIGLKPRAG